MISLIITSIRHTATGCYKGNTTSPEGLSADDQWLIGDGCLSSGYRSCEECDLCPVQDAEVVIDWFGTVISVVIRINNSPVGGGSESACPAESVDEDVCCAKTFTVFQ